MCEGFRLNILDVQDGRDVVFFCCLNREILTKNWPGIHINDIYFLIVFIDKFCTSLAKAITLTKANNESRFGMRKRIEGIVNERVFTISRT